MTTTLYLNFGNSTQQLATDTQDYPVPNVGDRVELPSGHAIGLITITGRTFLYTSAGLSITLLTT